MNRAVFVTGSTGSVGAALIPRLLARGHRVKGLVRPPSADRLPAGAEPVLGDALDAATFAGAIPPCDTLVHLVRTPSQSSPRKAAELDRVDLVSLVAAVAAAARARVERLVYVSVAQPAPVMRAYVAARARGEAAIGASGIAATLLRPWYVLGPGHRWPYLLLPLYAAASLVPASRATARRLGLVTRRRMLAALVAAVEDMPARTRIWEVPEIQAAPLD